MRKSALIGLLLAGAFGIPAASASTLFDISFSGTGTLPTAGSFTYDTSTSTFSAFSVTWEGTNFDLTGSANSPGTYGAGFPACIGGLSGGAATFAMLSGACDGTPNESTSWGGSAFAFGPEIFQFLTVYNTLVGGNYPQLFIYASNSNSLNLNARGGGSWTLTAATPEPSMAILWTLGLAALALVVRRRLSASSI